MPRRGFPQCDRYAWLDCDLLLPDKGWANRAADLLEHLDVLQLFARVLQLAPAATRRRRRGGWWGARDCATSLRSARLAARFDRLERFRSRRLDTAGQSADRRLENSGLYDRMILGGGDAFFADCLFDSFGLHQYWDARTDEMAFDMDLWRKGLASAGNLRIGYLPGDAYHLWHGRFADRRLRRAERDLETPRLRSIHGPGETWRSL